MPKYFDIDQLLFTGIMPQFKTRKLLATGRRNRLATDNTIECLYAQAHGFPLAQGASIYTYSKEWDKLFDFQLTVVSLVQALSYSGLLYYGVVFQRQYIQPKRKTYTTRRLYGIGEIAACFMKFRWLSTSWDDEVFLCAMQMHEITNWTEQTGGRFQFVISRNQL